MMTKLSIIVPCYNSEETLGAAVESVFQQDPVVPFDVTLVDDASTDGTYGRMRELAAKHPNIRLFRHTTNQGGGATRNTAVAQSDGDIIFCLDSDDVLDSDFLKNITRFWLKKRCDGVGISRSIKFKRRDTKDVAYVTDFADPGKQVRFESLLDGSFCSLTSTFLITRRAFECVGGYPTTHAFDTQGMAFRFLGNGLVAYTCPDTLYFHRVDFKDSYYIREQKADRLNWNWFHVLDEFLYLFTHEMRHRILESDLFAVPGKPAPPDLFGMLCQSRDIYVRNYRQLIRLGRDGVARRFRGADDGFWQYWLGGYEGLAGNHKKALDHYVRAVRLGFNYRIIYHRILSSALHLAGNSSSTDATLEELLMYARPFPASRLPHSERLFRALMRSSLLRGPALAAKRAYKRLRRPES